jgi:hypothetical protein
VELVKENEDASRVYFDVRGQTLNVWNGERDIPVDLNHLAVWAMIDAYGIKDRIGTFKKVVRCWHEIRAMQED